MDAEDLLMRQYLGIRTAAETAAAARWIRGEQRPDGTWGNYCGAPGDLSTTIEAYLALRLAGDAPEQPHMDRAARWVREQGGVEDARVFTRMWLALFGLWSWERVPAVRPSGAAAVARAAEHLRFGCWARQTVVAIALVSAHRPVRPLGVEIDELNGGRPAPPPACPLLARAFGLLDRGLHAYERHPLGPLRRHASPAPSAGWSAARRTTAAGAGSSRRGSSRSSPCTSAGSRSITPCSRARCAGSRTS